MIIGFIGFGKTTLSKKLAKRYNAKCFCIDHIMLERYGRSPQNFAELFQKTDNYIWQETSRFIQAGQDVILDYGSGKGRVGFFLSWQTRCRSTGVECDERIYTRAVENRISAAAASRVQFELQNAEEYAVPAEVTRCFFFNPFSVEILKKVLARILESWYQNPREILLFFYYPSDEYISHLMTVDELSFFDEIDCRLHGEKKVGRERIIIFSLGSEKDSPAA